MGSSRSKGPGSSLGAAAGGVVSALGGLAAGWILLSRFGIDHHVPLPPAIHADQERFVGQNSRFLNVYLDRQGSGHPLVLIHSINAGSSAYEMRPIFEQYRGRRPVYALDLPGFGISERADRVYTPGLYRDAIVDLLRQKVQAPADIVALSLGSEFAALAALEAPELVNSVTMISPTGFSERQSQRSSQRVSDGGYGDLAYNLFSFPVWSQAFYDLLVTRPSLRYFLGLSFVGPVDEGMMEYAYLTTHQPGARHAPLYFVSGKLFTPAVRETVYERLAAPVLVLFDEDAYTNFAMLPRMLAQHGNWQAVRIEPTRGLPHFEKMGDVARALDSFWLAVEA